MSAKAERGINHGHLANAELYTTRDVIAAEKVIFDRAADTAERYAAVDDAVAVDAILTAEAGQGYPLSAEQREAVGKVVTSDRALDTVLGPPGTGKTTTMRAAGAAWEAGNFRVLDVTTAAVAARHMAVEVDLDTRTVASVLMAPDRQLAEVDVLVVDEANLTDDRSRAALYAAAARHRVKVVEIGDPQQLRGVAAGRCSGSFTRSSTAANSARTGVRSTSLNGWRCRRGRGTTTGRDGRGRTGAGWWPPKPSTRRSPAWSWKASGSAVARLASTMRSTGSW